MGMEKFLEGYKVPQKVTFFAWDAAVGEGLFL